MRFLCNSDNMIVSLTVLAVILGLSVGIALKLNMDLSPRTIYLISFPGVLLMNMFKMLIIPLIVSSIVTGEFLLPQPLLMAKLHVPGLRHLEMLIKLHSFNKTYL